MMQDQDGGGERQSHGRGDARVEEKIPHDRLRRPRRRARGTDRKKVLNPFEQAENVPDPVLFDERRSRRFPEPR